MPNDDALGVHFGIAFRASQRSFLVEAFRYGLFRNGQIMMSLLVGASLLGSQAVEAAVTEDRPLARSITVVGSGEATAKPDMAEIQLGVTTQGQTAAEALKSNGASM